MTDGTSGGAAARQPGDRGSSRGRPTSNQPTAGRTSGGAASPGIPERRPSRNRPTTDRPTTDRPAGVAPAARRDHRLHLLPRHRAQIEALLREHLPGVEVWAYGSRVSGDSHDGSDLDLVLRAPGLDKVPMGPLFDLWDALRESTIPFLVEARDWARLPESFHGEIERDYVVLVEGSRNCAKHADGSTETAATTKPAKRNPGWHRHWKEYAVRDLIDTGSLEIGDGYRAKNTELSTSGLPFARAGNIKDGFHFDDADCFPTENLHRVRNKASIPGDVVFTSKGTVGRFAFVRENTPRFVYSPQLCFWRSLDAELIDPRFLYCWMSGPEFFRQFKEVSGQTDMAEFVSLRDQRDMRITLPPVREQRAIARVLGALDDKIELNRHMNATLEKTARALFQSWFVDFDPVRAKMAGRDPGLPEDIADLFPDRLVDSECGEIPVGWPVESLAEHFEAVKGVSYKGSGLGAEGVPLHNLNSIREGGGYKYEGVKYYSGEYSNRHRVRPGDVIVANTEQGHDRLLIGYAAVVPKMFGNHGIASHHVYRLRARLNGRLSTAFLHLLLNSSRMHDAVSGYANGTTVNMLPIDALQRPLVVIPPKALSEALDTVAVHAEQQRERIVRESRILIVVRDTLLPKLISGEIKVRGTETTAGVVA